MAELTSSVSSVSSASSWENVSLSPLDELALQYEQQLQQLVEANTPVQQNKQGVDLDAKTGKAAGRVVIKVHGVQGLGDAIAHHPMLGSAAVQPSVYVSTVISPTSSCEKATKKHLRSSTVRIVDGAAEWKDTLIYDGVKTMTFAVKVSVSSSVSVIADVALGETEISSSDFLDQHTHQRWFELSPPASAVGPSSVGGKVQLSVTFEYDTKTRNEAKIAHLTQKKAETDEYIESYRKTVPLVKAHSEHPAAYGSLTARAELYIPGNRFNAIAHHPAAVTRVPLADKTRVITPFGRGVIVSYRPESKIYIVQLDKDPAAKKANVAYLRFADVKEEPNEPHLKMYMKVSTPYGDGEIIEIRPHDDVIVVKTSYASLYMHRKDVKLPQKSIEDMTNKDLIDEAIVLTDKGNEQFRGNQWDEAVFSYLRALAFLQRVQQDHATHKEKATILQTMIRCHLNIGTCKLKADAYLDAEIACTNALSILSVLAENKHGNVVTWMGRLGLSEQQMFEDWPSKARFRRAKACFKLGKYLDARNDLMIAVKLNPKDKACRTLLDQVTKLINKQKQEEKKAWGGMFEKPSEQDLIKHVITAPQAASAASTDPDASIFTRKSKIQRAKPQPSAADETPWYYSAKALATASLVTAGVAALAMATLKQQKS
ncbi:hypothetical protein Poli38472_006558 [Pythium oligandrum]|uniref:peptidylprolyl isomerase n=1 Tax=Pythium oligandrum TaxID=41045 RepID=A0A8K1FF87_PYTOL|nr:hypothetical protein Poli38472_006558 [Pythium oligandrum]|eukprot:TMW56548.1 hypothetical protein Poli38472_006558 [Pythium oligandrum]